MTDGQVTLSLGVARQERLRLEAERRGLSPSDAIRQAVDAWLGADQVPSVRSRQSLPSLEEGPGRGRALRRVISLLTLLSASARARSSVELAEQLGRGDRTIRRDLEVLRACGLEVEVLRQGREISYRLPRAAIPVVCARCAAGGVPMCACGERPRAIKILASCSRACSVRRAGQKRDARGRGKR